MLICLGCQKNMFGAVAQHFNLPLPLIFMFIGNRLRDKIEVQDFIGKIRSYGPESIECSNHTFFRLGEKQRALFTCENIRQILLNGVPVLAGIQHNGCYAAFYKHENKRFIKIILDVRIDRIEVVTFYIIEGKQLPVIK